MSDETTSKGNDTMTPNSYTQKLNGEQLPLEIATHGASLKVVALMNRREGHKDMAKLMSAKADMLSEFFLALTVINKKIAKLDS